MSPPVTYKIHVANGRITCEPNGGGGRFSARTSLSWESKDGGQYTLTFFVWNGTKTTQEAWPFVPAPPTPRPNQSIAPNQAVVPENGTFVGLLQQVPPNDEGVYAYSISGPGTTLDPIIVVDN